MCLHWDSFFRKGFGKLACMAEKQATYGKSCSNFKCPTFFKEAQLVPLYCFYCDERCAMWGSTMHFFS